MPFIGASDSSNNEFKSLKQKLSIGNLPASSTSSLSLHKDSLKKTQYENPAFANDTQDASDIKGGNYSHCIKTKLESIKTLKIPTSNLCAPNSISNDLDFTEILKCPNGSVHAYSYNPLSVNSLAVRLSILKRSLEIMINNPTLLREPKQSIDLNVQTPVSSNGEYDFNAHQISYSDIFDIPAPQTLKNASSAALTAFFNNSGYQPKTSGCNKNISFQLNSGSSTDRSSSLKAIMPMWGIDSENINSQSETTSNSTSRRSSAHICDNGSMANNNPEFYNSTSNRSTESLNARRSDLESLLELLNETLENNTSDKASDLHMISLLNINKFSLNDKDLIDEVSKRHDQALKKNLWQSLAQPFFETYSSEALIQGEHELEDQVEQYSHDPSLLTKSYESTRILHTFVSGKHSTPQAIFTCSQQHPWKFRSANDLACLIFGVSRNALKVLTLLDLIHSDSRKFVLNKIMATEDQEQVFTGEIVGIIQPGNSSSNLIWSSIWAKRKNGMIVCIFEKVPCDYMDVMLNLEDFSVNNIVGGENLRWKKNIKTTYDSSKDSNSKKKSVKFANEIENVATISISLSRLIDDVKSGKLFSKDDDLLPMSLRVSTHINQVRYFTLNHLSHNIPCAISSSILENDLKLKMHSLPYQAGVFIIDKHFQLTSFNKSIAKNMFGYHAHELNHHSINRIIPSFPELIEYTNLKYPNFNINLPRNKGLVLTEHFFRKIQCELLGNGDDFYNSIGIDAIHRDGSVINVDIQLRVISTSYLLLWITHSRDVFFKNYSTNPSQLKILKENEITTVGSCTSSGRSSKNPTNKIAINDLKALDWELEKLKLDETVSPKNNDTTPLVCNNDYVETHKSSKGLDHSTNIKSDSDLDLKLEMTKKYNQNKSQFVKDSNFKLDETLILNLTSNSSSKSLGISGSPFEVQTFTDNTIYNTLLPTPVHEIGSLKHIRKFSDFLILQKMGEGAYGKVALCMHKKEKYIVVIKMIFKERILVDTWVRDRKLGTIPSEIQIMATLNKKPHENILTLIDFFEDDDYYYIETPLHGETGSIDLFDFIELRTDMTEYEAKLIFKQVVSGIKHLHNNGIVHRDIKDENVIIDNKGFVKIIDFGSAAYVKSGPFDVFVGTIDYAAPEVLGGDPYEGKPQDVWATGILLYTIVYKENPFYNIDEILDGDLRITPSASVSDDCVILIKKILNRSVTKRPIINEIFDDAWLQV